MNNINTQQLKIEHKNAKKDRREGKGRVLAISRRMYRLLRQNTSSSDIYYYVESESSDDHYYFVKYNPSSVVESWLCSCKDNSTRHTLKCKHLFAIEFAIKWGTIKDIYKLPITADTDQSTLNDIQIAAVVTTKRTTKSYLEDDYDF